MSIGNSIKNTISNFKTIGISSFLLIYSFSALSQPLFDSEPVTDAIYGSVYTYQVIVSGTDVRVRETGGNLPPGISFDQTTNILSGIPTATDNFNAVLNAREEADPSNFVLQEFDIIVAPADLTVTADPKTITFGDPIPDLTFSYSGFVNGDEATDLDTEPTASTTATSSSDAGTYPITVAGGVDTNYDFTYNNSTLIIEESNVKDDQTITFDPLADQTYGIAPITLSLIHI